MLCVDCADKAYAGNEDWYRDAVSTQATGFQQFRVLSYLMLSVAEIYFRRPVDSARLRVLLSRVMVLADKLHGAIGAD